MPYPNPSSLSDALAVFHAELARATVSPEQAAAGPALWPSFVGYYQGLARLPRKVRRALQRRWRRPLAAIALLLVLGQAPALAATIDVDGTICTLVDAITAANSNAPTGGCKAGSGADILVLPAGSTHSLTAVNNSLNIDPDDPISGDNGLPVIVSRIAIEGHGSTIQRSFFGAPPFRIFAVNATGDLTLNETTVYRGEQFTGIRRGGGVVVSGGHLTITNSTVSGNTAVNGGGVGNYGTATLTNSTVSGNYARDYGGGVRSFLFGTLTLTNSTVSGNSAGLSGGGMSNGGTATLTNSTVSGNSAVFSGGGVASRGTTTLKHSLVSGNTATQGAEVDAGFDNGGTVTANNFNFFGHSGLTYAQAFSGFALGETDLTATSGSATSQALGAILNTLANNGGPTKTHALLSGSLAIDAVGTGCPPPATDQRGISRPQGPACDIGAFERGTAPADLAVSLTGSPDPVTVNQTLAYTITARNNGPSQATGVQVTDTLPQGVVLDYKPPQCTGSSSVTCNLGPLAVGAEATVTILVIPKVPGTVGNTVRVVANQLDPNPANDSATETTTVQPPSLAQADLAITAAATPDPGASGQTLTYTLTVRNDGPATATDVQVTDILPVGVVLAFKPSECEGSTAVICNLGTLPSGGQATVTIDVVPRTAGTLTHGPRITGAESDPNPENDAASVTTLVEPPLEPTSRATCSTRRCALPLACNQAESLGDNCENDVTLVVNVPGARLSDELQTRAIKRIRFATAITNIPPGRTEKVRFKLTARAKLTTKRLIEKGKRKLRGVMEIRNTAGGTDTIPLTVRLK